MTISPIQAMLRALAPLALLALPLAACGGDDDDEATTPTAEEITTASEPASASPATTEPPASPAAGDATAEGTADTAGIAATVTVGAANAATMEELPAAGALQWAETEMGFPVLVARDWPLPDMALTGLMTISPPVPRNDNRGNTVDAIYKSAAGASASVSQWYTGDDAGNSGHMDAPDLEFEVDGELVEAVIQGEPGGHQQYQLVMSAGPYLFTIVIDGIDGEALPEPEAFTPMLQSLITPARAGVMP